MTHTQQYRLRFPHQTPRGCKRQFHLAPFPTRGSARDGAQHWLIQCPRPGGRRIARCKAGSPTGLGHTQYGDDWTEGDDVSFCESWRITSWMWLAFSLSTPLGAMVRGALMPEGSDFWSSHERRDAAAAAECWSHAGRSFWHPLAAVWVFHATRLAHYAFGPAALPENGNPPT